MLGVYIYLNEVQTQPYPLEQQQIS
ncbi:protein of unknown function [Kingella kingae]|nr:protein of unknown function [Kingella kingae]